MLLNCHTYYSFCYGTLSTEALFNELISKGYQQFVLSDINNTSACLDAVRLAQEKNIQLALGIDFRDGAEQKFIGIAQNNQGFEELNRYLSSCLHSGEKPQVPAPDFNQAFVVYPFSAYGGQPLKAHEWIGIQAQELKFLPFSKYRHLCNKMVVLQTLTYTHRKQYNAHRLLRAIDKNVLLSRLPVSEQAKDKQFLLYKSQLLDEFKQYPGILSNTKTLLDACSIHFEYGKLCNKNLKHYTGTAEGDTALLRSACYKGLSYRYPDADQQVLNRIEKELEVIETLHFESYFLINWDIVNYARHKNYYYVGRGSGANSILAYLLRITDVDPIELDLYFERFINIYRNNAPDFDMDFSWTDRDDITEYIFKRFGNERTALLGAYNTFQHDAVIRELGKVFGLPSAEIDKLQKLQHPQEADEISRMVLHYGNLLKGFPSHLSIHSSGIIISEAPIYAYTATSMPPKGFQTTQFSMLEAEDIGLYKFDILSQRGLGKIKDCLQLVKENKGVEIDIHQIKQFKKDEKIKSLLRSGNTIACFYVESPAMRMLLTKLKADDYLRLVAASSIIRPGVARSGMMREYIVRYRDPALREKARAALPALYELLEETYGVMVYQEDVIKIAHFFAGLSLAEADYLRRGMSWKFKQRNEFGRVKNNFFKNCRAKKYPEKMIQDIWVQIESFANFAFSKGHSASYAVESYQALFLKAYFPLEYLTATLNNGGGFYHKELYLHEAKLLGAEIKHPCINTSGVLCRIRENRIYLGLSMIAGIEEKAIYSLLIERERKGAYKDLADFISRNQLPLDQMRLLIRAHCFDFTGRKKAELLWEMHALVQPLKQPQGYEELFPLQSKKWKIPPLFSNAIEEAFEEMELFGFPFCSPFDLVKDALAPGKLAADLPQCIGQQVDVYAMLVTIKYARTVKGERMYFGTFLDRSGAWIDSVHFPSSASKYPFTGKGCYHIRGRVVEEYDFICIEVDLLKRLPMIDREKNIEQSSYLTPQG